MNKRKKSISTDIETTKFRVGETVYRIDFNGICKKCEVSSVGLFLKKDKDGFFYREESYYLKDFDPNEVFGSSELFKLKYLGVLNCSN